MIEALQGKHVKEIACGSGHSAAITSNGELYTWGQGDHGRLGHGDQLNQNKPKQVSQVWVLVAWLNWFVWGSQAVIINDLYL